MRRKILASLLLAGALSGLYRLGAQTPEPVALTVRPTESKEFTFKQVDRDVYEVTTAPGSAVIRFEPGQRFSGRGYFGAQLRLVSAPAAWSSWS